MNERTKKKYKPKLSPHTKSIIIKYIRTHKDIFEKIKKKAKRNTLYVYRYVVILKTNG